MRLRKLLLIMAGTFLLLIASCSSHINDLQYRTSDIGVDVDISFRALVLGYDFDEGRASAAGITGEDVTYAWYLDNVLQPSTGATCDIDPKNLSVGKHTLMVVATVDGMEYSADCIITVTSE